MSGAPLVVGEYEPFAAFATAILGNERFAIGVSVDELKEVAEHLLEAHAALRSAAALIGVLVGPDYAHEPRVAAAARDLATRLVALGFINPGKDKTHVAA